MEQETYLERIKMLKSQRKITNDKLSEMTGIPLGTLAKLLAGISDSPKLSNIVAISRALDCSLDWLITGVPENTNNYTLEPAEITLVESYRALDGYGRELVEVVMAKERSRTDRQADEELIRMHDLARRTARRGGTRLRRPEENLSEEETPISASALSLPASLCEQSETVATETPAATILSVPRSRIDHAPAGLGRRSIALYDMPVSAGGGEFLYDLPVSSGTRGALSDNEHTEIIIPDDARTAEADYALRINGDSMEPKYHSGDILLIQTTESVEEGELGIFVLDGSGFFKKYGGDHLISLNPSYPPIRLRDFEQVSCCGRVVGKLKRK